MAARKSLSHVRDLRRLVVVLYFVPGSIRVGQGISDRQRLFVVSYFMPCSIRIGLLIIERYPEVDCCFVFCTRLDPHWAAAQRSQGLDDSSDLEHCRVAVAEANFMLVGSCC